MNHFTAEDTFIIVGIVIAYILFTTPADIPYS